MSDVKAQLERLVKGEWREVQRGSGWRPRGNEWYLTFEDGSGLGLEIVPLLPGGWMAMLLGAVGAVRLQMAPRAGAAGVGAMTGYRPERIDRDEETHETFNFATERPKTLVFLRGWRLWFRIEDEAAAHALFDAFTAGRALVDEDGRRAYIRHCPSAVMGEDRLPYVEVRAYVRAAEQPREEDAPREGGCWRIET